MPESDPSACVRTLILGGTRSGKSRLAERLAQASGQAVVYVATAQAGDDAEMQARIAAHQARRPAAWRLVEEPLALAKVLDAECAEGRCVVVECLTLWLANLLWQPDRERVGHELAALDACLPHLPGELVLVGNETNLGIVPVEAGTRHYCDLAGELHQRIAGVCDRVVLTVAGLPLVLKGPSV